MAFRRTLLPSLALLLLLLAAVALPAHSQLSPNFYDSVCPQAIPTIREIVRRAIYGEPRMGASLLRLQFHDCFVNGCDGSLLLDGPDSEKTAPPNMNSTRGFEVIDAIKDAVDRVCYGSVVSCADILAVAARDSVAVLGGPSYQVQLGRKDSKRPFKDLAGALPGPSLGFQGLVSSFRDQGLTVKDLVALAGGHTIGYAKCQFVKPRITGDKDIDQGLAGWLQQRCPAQQWSDPILVPLDISYYLFDNGYYKNLVRRMGILHSDQQLFKGDGGESDGLVKYYSENQEAFFKDFGESMVRMGNINPLTGDQGEVRRNCRKPNN